MPRRVLVWVALAAAACFTGGCQPEPVSPFGQPGDVVWTVGPADSGSIPHDHFPLSSVTSGSSPGFPWPPIFSLRLRTRASKLHPDLRPLLRTGDTSSIELVIELRDRSVVPRLPVERVESGQDSIVVTGGLSTIDSLHNVLRDSREIWYPGQRAELEKRFGARVRDQYVLTQSVLALVPRNRIRDLAGWDEVMCVSPARVRSTPPQTQPTSVLGASTAVGLDHLRDQGDMVGSIRLLDTGVDAAHPFLVNLPHSVYPFGSALLPRDCVNSVTCSGLDTRDCQSYPGHGTGSAGILVAGGVNASGEQVVPRDDRGVTDANLWSCRVEYYQGGHVYYDVPAIKAALYDAQLPTASVIAIELQSIEGSEGVVATSANLASQTGTVVVAAIGNAGPYQPNSPTSFLTGPMSPGSARRVLGVGARESSDLSTIATDQSWGAVYEATKPELQFPTSTSSPARTDDPLVPNAPLQQIYPQTSGATPYAAAAALGMRHFLMRSASVVDPGQVYAALIACGSEMRRKPFADFPRESGAGLFVMPDGSKCWFGRLRLSSGGFETINLSLDNLGMRKLRVGLWWADPNPQVLAGIVFHPHVDFDLALTTSAGHTLLSVGEPGCFERIGYDSPNPKNFLSGSFRLSIIAANTGFHAVPVYWAVFALP